MESYFFNLLLNTSINISGALVKTLNGKETHSDS